MINSNLSFYRFGVIKHQRSTRAVAVQLFIFFLNRLNFHLEYRLRYSNCNCKENKKKLHDQSVLSDLVIHMYLVALRKETKDH